MPPRQSSAGGDSYIVSLYGLDGKREHYMPGNLRRGTGVREKRPFESEDEARAFGKTLPTQPVRVYCCSICDKWHIASPKRHGSPA